MNVHFALLALLAGGPRSGLRLRAELETGPSGLHPLSASQVYPALARLGRAGLVETGGAAGAEGPEQEFRITDCGRRELAGWLRTTPDPPTGDDLVAKVLLAGRVPGTDVREVIQAHRRSLIELMQQWTQARQAGRSQDLGPALASYAELFRLDSVIRWLDTADSLVDPIRVSDTERDQATVTLRHHFAAGRLTHAELDARLTAALTARTAGDLRCLLADLP
jgi:DNA-binding PadR family transcriptional regulator